MHSFHDGPLLCSVNENTVRYNPKRAISKSRGVIPQPIHAGRFMDTFVENNFPNLVSLIYEAALDHTRWQAFLDQLPAAFDGARGILRVCDNSATPPAALLFNCDPDYIRSYATYFHTLNPYSDEHARALAVGEVSFVSRFVPQADVEKSTYYHEWLRPQGITGNHLTCSLFRSLGTVATLGLAPHEASYRKDPYRYATRLRHLVPHMVRAVAVNHLLANVRRAEHALGSSLDALGAAAFVLEASGQLLHVNGLAEAMLRAADVIACKADGSLVAKNAADEPALEAAIHGAAAPGAHPSVESPLSYMSAIKSRSEGFAMRPPY